MSRTERTSVSRKKVEATPARVARDVKQRESKSEAKRYAAALARVRLARAWVAALAAIGAMLSTFLPLLERLGRWWASVRGWRAPRRAAVLAASYLFGVLAPAPLLASGAGAGGAGRSIDRDARHYATVQVDHDAGGIASVTTNAASSTTFTVTNIGVATQTLSYVVTVCNGSLAVGSCSASPTGGTLAPTASMTVTVYFSGGTTSGTGTLTLAAKNASGSTLASASVTVTVTGVATVSDAPHVGDRRDVAQCVADCFESTLSYTTPAYVSLDVPRSVTLLYRSGRAYPHGRLALDATDATAPAGASFRLRLKDSAGTYLTFTNNSTELYFARAASGATRLVAEFDATTIPTSARLYTAEVTPYYPSTGLQGATTKSVRIIVINDMASPLGAGVEIAGLQRLFTTQGGVLVTEGSGSATFFSGSCSPSVSCTFTAPAGEFSRLTTTGTGYRRVYPDSTALTFTAAGYHTATADRFGTTTQIAYGTTTTGQTAPNAITDPTGQSITFWYRYPGALYGWGDGTLGNIHTPAGDAPIAVDTLNNARQWVELGGGTYRWRMSYGAQHLLDTAYDKANSAWLHHYRYGATLDYTEAPAITVAGGATARPRVTLRNAADALLAGAVPGNGTSSTPLAVPADLRALVIGPRNDTTFVSLNRFGAPRKTTAPLTPSDSVEYNETTGQVARTISPTGMDVRYTWSADKLTKVQNVTLGTQDSIEYETQYGLPKHLISSTSAERWLAYDQTKTGWPLQTTRIGLSTATPTTHYADARGRDTTVVDPATHTTKWYYAATGLQNLDSVRAPNLTLTRFGRDGWGRVVSTRDPYGARDSTLLDVLNRPTWVAGPLYNDTTRYTYDLLNNVTSVTDAKNQVYAYQRNALGWVTSLTHPGTLGSDSTWYDIAGNPVQVRTRADRQVTLDYDVLGRVTKKTSRTGGDTITYTYDPAGRWTTARTVSRGVWVSTDSIRTDSLGRTVSEATMRPGSGSAWYVATYYNATDPGPAYSLAYKNGSPSAEGGANYYYDSVKRLSSIVVGTATTRLTYNAEQLRDTIVFPSGLRETWQYTSSHALAKREYSVTALGDSLTRAYRTDSLARLVERASGTNGTFQLFDYDSKGRLAYWQKKHQTPGTSCVNLGGWGYDCSGASTTLDQLVTATYDQVENPADPGTTLGAGNRLTAFNGVSMTYDADGNLVRRVSGGVTDSLVWDDFGQLEEMRRNGATVVTFDYDGFGRRIRKRTASDTVQYVWAGDQLMLEATGSGATLRSYTYYPGVDRLHSVSTPTATYYASIEPATGDINGLITGSNDSLAARYAYTPWGELEVEQQVAGVNSLRWKGLLYDSETGLYYVRARYYDPKVRRFVSEDPIGLDGGINVFTFTGGDPLNGNDPSGLDGNNGYTGCWDYVEITQGAQVIGSYLAPVACGGMGVFGPSLAEPHGLPGWQGPATGPTGQTTGAGPISHVLKNVESFVTSKCTQSVVGLGMNVLGDWAGLGTARAALIALRGFQRERALAQMFMRGSQQGLRHAKAAGIMATNLSHQGSDATASIVNGLDPTLLRGPVRDVLEITPFIGTIFFALPEAYDSCFK